MKIGRYVLCLTSLVLLGAPAWSAGIVSLDFGGNTDDRIALLRVGTTGQIYAQVRTDTNPQRCGLYGFDANGTLSANFGTAGRLVPDVCVPDLKGLAGGSLQLLEGPTAQDPWHVRQRSATGALVSTSADLYPRPPLSNKRRSAFALDVLADGRTIVGGTGTETTASTENWNVARVNADGTLDATFGGGLVLKDVGGSQTQQLIAIYALAGNKILATGTRTGPGNSQTVLVRFNADGTTDAGFGANGQLLLPDGPGLVAFDSLQQIYVPGADGTVVRLSADGVADGSYAGGSVLAGVLISDIAVDAGGRAVLFGVSGAGAGATGFVSRLDSTGVADTTFNVTGQASITFPTGIATAVVGDARCRGALQNASLPLLACTVVAPADPQVGAGTDLALARLTSSGALDATFGTAQQDSDTYPDSFAFTSASAPYGAARVVSNTVAIAGINSPTSISIVAGASAGAGYSIGCNGSFTASAGLLAPGQSVCVRQDAVAQPNASSQSTLLVGGRAAVFTVNTTNAPADSTPDSFTFADPVGIAVSTLLASNSITISGITGYATISVVNGSYSIGCTAQSFDTASSTVSNGAVVCVRHTTAATAGTAVSTTLTVGGVSDTFTTTTAAAVVTPAPPATPPATGGGGGAMDEILIALLALLALLRTQRGAFGARATSAKSVPLAASRD